MIHQKRVIQDYLNQFSIGTKLKEIDKQEIMFIYLGSIVGENSKNHTISIFLKKKCDNQGYLALLIREKFIDEKHGFFIYKRYFRTDSQIQEVFKSGVDWRITNDLIKAQYFLFSKFQGNDFNKSFFRRYPRKAWDGCNYVKWFPKSKNLRM